MEMLLWEELYEIMYVKHTVERLSYKLWWASILFLKSSFYLELWLWTHFKMLGDLSVFRNGDLRGIIILGTVKATSMNEL